MAAGLRKELLAGQHPDSAAGPDGSDASVNKWRSRLVR